MRAAILVALLAAASALLQACAGGSVEPPWSPTIDPARVDFSALPRDEQALQDLNARHRRLIRRAENRCAAEGRSGGGWPCIRGIVDREVAREHDPALTAFHYALPVQHRYDSGRASSVWRDVRGYVPKRAWE